MILFILHYNFNKTNGLVRIGNYYFINPIKERRIYLKKQQLLLEENIQSLSSDYIYNQALGSLLLLLLSCVEEEQNTKKLPYKIHSEILELKQAIKQYVCKIEELLNGDKESKQSALENCFDLKNSILSIYKNIYQYFVTWNLYGTLIQDETALRKYSKENTKSEKIQFNVFYMDCEEFLNSAKTVSEQKKYIGQLLKCIPFKMAREKYFDIVTNCLENAFASESEETISMSLSTFQHTCAPEKYEGYGKYFSEIAQWLTSKRDFRPEALNDEELEEAYNDFNTVFESLTQIEDYFECLLNDINSLIILFYLNYTFDELTELDFSYSDLYHTVCELYNGELDETEKPIYLDTLNTRLEEAFEPIIDKANDINKKELKLLEQIEDFSHVSEDTSKMLASEGFIRSCFYGDLNKEIFDFIPQNNQPPASKEFKTAKFKEFISFIRQYLGELPPQTRKTAMQLFLYSLPPVFSVAQALEMVQNGIENAPDIEHQLLIIDKVEILFKSYGFYHTQNAADTCNCGQHHHHHDDCNCGQHHHHHGHT